MRNIPRNWIPILLLIALLPSTLSAYTIILKDGSSIQSQGTYEVKGDKAYFVLVNGTQTVLDLEEIDVEATRKINELDVGDARLIEDSEVRVIGEVTEPAKNEISLSDLSRANLEAKAKAEAEAGEVVATIQPKDIPRTLTGNIDLLGLPRRLYRDESITRKFIQAFTELETLDHGFFMGTTDSRLFIEVTTNDEAKVFDLLQSVSETFLSLGDRGRQSPEAIELLLLTGGRERAGQFTIDRARAEELTQGEISVPRFFLTYVEF